MPKETDKNFCDCGTFLNPLKNMKEDPEKAYAEELGDVPEEEYPNIRYCPSCGELYRPTGSTRVKSSSKEEPKGSGGKVIDDDTADMLGYL